MDDNRPFGALKQEELKKTLPHRVGRPIMMQKATTVRSQFIKACIKSTPEALQYVLFLSGLMAITFGFWMIYQPLGPIVGGIVAVFVGMSLSVEEKK